MPHQLAGRFCHWKVNRKKSDYHVKNTFHKQCCNTASIYCEYAFIYARNVTSVRWRYSLFSANNTGLQFQPLYSIWRWKPKFKLQFNGFSTCKMSYMNWNTIEPFSLINPCNLDESHIAPIFGGWIKKSKSQKKQWWGDGKPPLHRYATNWYPKWFR